MPLSRPALTLAPGPKGVQDARRWAVEACQELERHDLVDCAELGVSELVSNAILHGADPIQVRMRGTTGRPRIEVRDASVDLPAMPLPLTLDDEEDLLLTFGRGLSIVARSSTAWGAEIETDGKVVWFEPADDFSEDDGVEGTISIVTAPEGEDGEEDVLDIVISGVPLRMFVGFQAHVRELRREARLLALADSAGHPFADDLSELFSALETELHTGVGLAGLLDTPAEGALTADLTVQMPRKAAPTLQRFLQLLDLADEFAHQERLLSLARTEEQRAFQTWFLGEYVRQAAGRPPLPWPGLPEQLHAVGQ